MRFASRFAFISAVAAGVTAAPVTAQQSAYPVKPVRFVVGVAIGNTADINARILGPKLSERWGQPVIVDNRPGGSTTVASNLVAKAVPDGYTLNLVSNAFAISAAGNPKLPYDPLKDFAGVTQIGFPTGALVVAPALGIKTVKELIALARAQPGKLIFGAGEVGTGTYFNVAMFNAAAGINALHVPYNGQPAYLIDVIAGRIHYAVAGLGASVTLIKGGKLLALAVTAPQRSPLLPDVPITTEVLPDWKRDGWHFLLAPARTPRQILHQISKEVARVFNLPDVKAQFDAVGFHLSPSTPEEADRSLRADIETFTRVANTAGLRGQ